MCFILQGQNVTNLQTEVGCIFIMILHRKTVTPRKNKSFHLKHADIPHIYTDFFTNEQRELPYTKFRSKRQIKKNRHFSGVLSILFVIK